MDDGPASAGVHGGSPALRGAARGQTFLAGAGLDQLGLDGFVVGFPWEQYGHRPVGPVLGALADHGLVSPAGGLGH